LKPEFQRAVASLSRKPIEDIASMDSPKDVAAAMIEPQFGVEGVQQFQEGYDQLTQHLTANPSVATELAAVMKSGGGAAAPVESASPENLLAVVDPNPAGESSPSSLVFDSDSSGKKVNLENNASAGAIDWENNKTVSLFERVSRKYFAVRDRLAESTYKTQENRSLSR
jgi:hypothetical protein